jgi:Uma2 family endonuclease
MANEVKEPAFKYNYVAPEDYLAAERASEEKHEYYDGQVLAMSGAGLRHNQIEVNLITSMKNFLKGKTCSVLPGNMRVSTPAQDAYMYPDALIVCGEPALQDNVFDALLNPSVIFEILSPSTRGIDKGRKLFFYQRIPSLREYIVIDSQKRFVQLARKQPNGSWLFEEISDVAGSLFIQTIDFTVLLEEIYTGTGL